MARLYRWHVERPRLTHAIEASSARVVLLVAPAGYGKTTTAQEWVAGKRCAWYRPTAASADVAAFAAELAEAARPLVPEAGRRLSARLREGPVGALAAADLLAPELGGWPDDAWLVVDDYHHADSPAVAELIDRLLDLTPIRLVVATRSRPVWATARRQVYGGIVELGDDELAMTPEEAAQVLSGRAGEAAQHAGWPALIGLAAIAASTELPSGRMSQALYRYLAAEVLEQRPPDERRFMLRASVPFAVDAHRFAGAEALIESLAADSILHETGEGTYRFHPLLRDFLRRRLRHEDAALFTRLALELAAVARAEGRWEEGVELALDAGDVEQAAAIVGEGFRAQFAQGRVETVERWVERCASARGDAAFNLARAEVAMSRGRVHEAQLGFEHAVASLGDDHPLAARARRDLAYAHEHFSRYPAAVDAALGAVDVSTGGDERVESLYLAVRTAAECRPDLLPALVRAVQAEPPTVEAQATLAMARMFAGIHARDLSGLVELVDGYRELTETMQPTLRRRLLVGAAYLALSRGEYRRSCEIVRAAIALAEEFHFNGVVRALRYVELANACTGLRELRAAERALQQAARIAPGDVAWVEWERGNAAAKLALARGELAEVADGEQPGPTIPAHRAAERAGLRAIAAAALGRLEQAAAEIEAARAGGGPAIEAHFYARFAEAILEPSRTAEVVADAFRSDFHDACTIAYRAHAPLLGAAAAEQSLRPELTRLVRAANDRALGRGAGLLPQAADGPPPPALTPREAEVLRLLVEGLSDREIAARLYIARSTAKLHVHHVLEKLGVSTRTQAVVAAQRRLLA